jgi:glutathione synthase/RimK-type ligase-like ATP-grasp enzyme
MTGWIIYDEKGFRRNAWFASEMIKHLGCKLIIAERLEFGVDGGVYYIYEGTRIEKPDYAVQRCIFPLLSLTLERDGVRLFNNARVCEICNDKRRTHLLAEKLTIPMLKTSFADKRFLCPPKLPVVVKSAVGHGGSEVFMAKTEDELYGALDKIEGFEVLFQQIASDIGTDKRLYVLGGEVIAAVMRRSESGFKSNFSLGGSAELSEALPKEREIAQRLAAELDADFIGVDFVYDGGEPLLNEVEDIVGTRMLYELTDMDAAKVYADYIVCRTDCGCKRFDK